MPTRFIGRQTTQFNKPSFGNNLVSVFPLRELRYQKKREKEV
jgi:hypothetical protein